MVSVSGPFWPWQKVYQRLKSCNELTLLGTHLLPRACLCCWQDYTNLFRFHVVGCAPSSFPPSTDCAPSSFPPSTDERAKCDGGWMQEMECLGYRNRFRPLMRAPKETLPPRGVWPYALARVQFLRCCIPNPAWCRLKKREVKRKRPKIPASRRNANAVQVSRSLGPDCLDVFGDDSCRFYLYLMYIYVAVWLLY
jgi:hypothetical protein